MIIAGVMSKFDSCRWCYVIIRILQVFEIENLPKGKYIVCGESNVDDEIIQTNCFQTIISKLDNNRELIDQIVLVSSLFKKIYLIFFGS